MTTNNVEGERWEERFKLDWDSGVLSWNSHVDNGISYERVKTFIRQTRHQATEDTIAMVLREIEGMKLNKPDFTIEDAFEGGNQGDIASVSFKDGFNQCITDLTLKLKEGI